MRVGIFFGGISREREISFAGGRTVYDNLDKNLFEAVPIFVDSFGNFVLLDWKYIYKGTIRDFFPPENKVKSIEGFHVYEESVKDFSAEEIKNLLREVGEPLSIEQLKAKIDFAFLALHGSGGEDGTIQGLLEYLGIPYSGSGILPSAIGINKVFQKKMMKEAGWKMPKSIVVSRKQWFTHSGPEPLFEKIKTEIGFPFVVRPANQGSSIGVSIIKENDLWKFCEAVEDALFVKYITKDMWVNKNDEEKKDFVNEISEIKSSIGSPFRTSTGEIIYHPYDLKIFLDKHFLQHDDLILESLDSENEVLVEEFIDGKEFSCIVIRDEEENVIALPPTEIVKGKEVFDYRSKYLPGLSRKITPINLPDENIQSIRKDCEKLFSFFNFNVYARIDGFIKPDGTIFLNDPNTTSGMLPSSFFFHQAAEIGLNPSQFLTFIIRQSLAERIRTGFHVVQFQNMMNELDNEIEKQKTNSIDKIRVAVILGGYSSERHISIESGRNIYEKLASSTKYSPVPIFLTGSDEVHELWKIPINILLKDNADDIADKVHHYKLHPVIEEIKMLCKKITQKYSLTNYEFAPKKISYEEIASAADVVFIALHGRPGEDGAVQAKLDKLGLPYNGSGVSSSQITINKFLTNQLLKQNGFLIAEQFLAQKSEWKKDENNFISSLLKQFHFPFICKPVDDGCSSAVKKIKNENELRAFCKMIFREEEKFVDDAAAVLQLKPKEEFPQKKEFLVEDLIERNGAKHFLEITGGMLTKRNENGELIFEMFEPSEALASDDVLSLEEKFLAGEGQNITPARFADADIAYEKIASQVKDTLEKAARNLHVRGYCRIDAFVRIFENGKVETVIIEVNSLPGMTPATCIYHQAALNGYKPFAFIDKILDFSIQNKTIGTA